MEPASPERVIYTIITKVTKTSLIEGQWYVHFLGSWEMLGLGSDPLDMNVGDEIIIKITRRPPDANLIFTPE